ncbi:MAG: hypothetical protein JNN01_00260, partial [Opitutaceae bacterium]|nr:hypothetical protein [Opitutaceae bacterium]
MSTASTRFTHRSRVSLHAIGLSLVFLLLALPSYAVTFDLTGASGSGTQTVQQTVGSDILVITAVDDVFVVDSDTNVWGGGISNTSGTVLAVASGVGYESKVTISVSGGKVFDLSSFTLVDIAGENKDLTITTNKGSQTLTSSFSSLSWSVTLASATFQGITYAELTTSHVSNQFAWGMDNFVLSNITLAPPTVTDARISLTSTGSGTGGAYKVGDTVTASWNNTGSGDNNAGITGVTMDFSQFGGGAAVSASNSSGTWTASFTLTAGAIDTTNRNVSVSATSVNGTTTTADTTQATVDNIAPTVTDARISISGASGTGGAFKIGDTVTATWNNTAAGDNNSDTLSTVTVNFSQFGGGAAVSASNSAGTWTATHTLTAGAINGTPNRNVSVTVTDNAGNTATRADTTNATVDNVAPTTTVSSLSFSSDTGSSSSDFITASSSQTLSGTLSANLVSGESVEVSINNGSTWANATASVGTNTWSLAGLTLLGSDTLRVRVTDGAGNSGTTLTQAYALDTTAPTTTISTLAFSADTGASSTDFITRTAAQTVSGTLSTNLVSGELVEVSLDNGSTWTTATSSVGSNTYSLSGVTLVASDTLRVHVTDNAGNSGTTRSQAFVLDTTAPTTTVATLAFSADTGASSTDFITRTAAQTVSGTLSANLVSGEFVEVS